MSATRPHFNQKIWHFRNYQIADLDFSDKLTIFWEIELFSKFIGFFFGSFVTHLFHCHHLHPLWNPNY